MLLLCVLCVWWSPASADKQTSAHPTVIIVCKLFSLFLLFLPLCVAAKIFKDAWGKDRPRLFVALCIINKRDTFWFSTLTVRLSAQLHFSAPISSPSVGCLGGEPAHVSPFLWKERLCVILLPHHQTAMAWSPNPGLAIWLCGHLTPTYSGQTNFNPSRSVISCLFVVLLFFFCFVFYILSWRCAHRCCPEFCFFHFPLTCPRVFPFDPATLKLSALLSHSPMSRRSLCFSLSPAPQLKRSPDTEVLSRRHKQAGPLGTKKGFGFISVPAAQKLLRTLMFPPKQRPPRWLYGRVVGFFSHLAALWKEHLLLFPASDWLFFSWGTGKTVGGLLSCPMLYSYKALGISPRPGSTATLLLASPDEFYFCLQQDKR